MRDEEEERDEQRKSATTNKKLDRIGKEQEELMKRFQELQLEKTQLPSSARAGNSNAGQGRGAGGDLNLFGASGSDIHEELARRRQAEKKELDGRDSLAGLSAADGAGSLWKTMEDTHRNSPKKGSRNGPAAEVGEVTDGKGLWFRLAEKDEKSSKAKGDMRAAMYEKQVDRNGCLVPGLKAK